MTRRVLIVGLLLAISTACLIATLIFSAADVHVSHRDRLTFLSRLHGRCSDQFLTGAITYDDGFVDDGHSHVVGISNECADADTVRTSNAVAKKSTREESCEKAFNIVFDDGDVADIREGSRTDLEHAERRSRTIIVRSKPASFARCDDSHAELKATLIVSQEYSLSSIVLATGIFTLTILSMYGYKPKWKAAQKGGVPELADDNTPRKKLDVRTALVFGGIALTFALHNETTLSGHLTSWSDNFTVILLAFSFVRIASKRHFPNDVRTILASINLRKSHSIAISVLATFVVNIIITSASATCTLLAVVIVPFLVSADVSSRYAAGAVMLGAWGGFLNPTDTGGAILSDILKHNELGHVNFFGHVVVSFVGLVTMTWMFVRAAKQSTSTMREKDDAKQSMNIALQDGKEPIPARRGAIITISPLIFYIIASAITPRLSMQYSATTILSLSFGISIFISLALRRDQFTPLSLLWEDLKTIVSGAWSGLTSVVMLVIAARVFAAPLAGPFSLLPPVLAPILVVLCFALVLAIGSGDGVVATFLGTIVPYLAGPAAAQNIGGAMWYSTELGRCASPNSPALHALLNAVQQSRNEAKQSGVKKDYENDESYMDRDHKAITKIVIGPIVVGLLAGYVAFAVLAIAM